MHERDANKLIEAREACRVAQNLNTAHMAKLATSSLDTLR